MTLNFEAGYMHAVFPHATTRRFLAARAGSIYAPALRARDHTTLSDSGFSAEDGGASKAEPASAAFIAVANSFGVRYPKLLWSGTGLREVFPGFHNPAGVLSLDSLQSTGSTSSSPEHKL